MSELGAALLLLALALTARGSAAASLGRRTYHAKPSLAAGVLHPRGLPGENGPGAAKPGPEWRAPGGRGEYTLAFPPVLDVFESYRGRLALDLQLRKVTLYYSVDYANSPVVSYYPKSGASEPPKPCPAAGRPRRPNYYTLVRDFLALFGPDEKEKKCTRHSYGQMAQNLPNALVLFMDPNSCADHVVELNRQDREARMASCELNSVFRLFERGLNMYRDKQTLNVVVPLSESLVFATNRGGSNFSGTPVFTTNPPVYVSSGAEGAGDKGSGKKGEFDRFDKSHRLLVFFSPDEAREFYKKVRWSKALRDEKTGRVYRIWSGSPPLRPELRVTSLEKVYGRVHGSEPHWGYLLEFVPPAVKPDERTALMLKESCNWLLVPWYALKRMLRGLRNQAS